MSIFKIALGILLAAGFFAGLEAKLASAQDCGSITYKNVLCELCLSSVYVGACQGQAGKTCNPNVTYVTCGAGDGSGGNCYVWVAGPGGCTDIKSAAKLASSGRPRFLFDCASGAESLDQWLSRKFAATGNQYKVIRAGS
jgi:hypothetical protein